MHSQSEEMVSGKPQTPKERRNGRANTILLRAGKPRVETAIPHHGGSKMKFRLAAVVLLPTLAAAACTSGNPVAPKSPPSASVKDGGNWMGSGH